MVIYDQAELEPAMSDIVDDGRTPLGTPSGSEQAERARLPLAAQYGTALIMVAVATLLAFVVDHLVAAPNLTLVFVLPVVIAATSFGWGPSLAAAVSGVLAFDFFFTHPYYSFQITRPSDIWAAALLLVTAAIVSTVAADARRRAMEARQAADQAQALQALAHVVIESKPQAEVVQAAAVALSRIFQAPAVVFTEPDGKLQATATAGGARITDAEEEAARGSLETRTPMRAEAYPYDQSQFDVWPLATASGCRCVLGVAFGRSRSGRPDAPDRFVEIVGAYLASGSRRG